MAALLDFVNAEGGRSHAGALDLFEFIPVEKARENSGALDLLQRLQKPQDDSAIPTDGDGSTKTAIKEHIKNAGSRLGSEAGARLASLLG